MSRRGIAGRLKSTHAYTSHTTIGNITKRRRQNAFEVTWYQIRMSLNGLLNAVVGSFTSCVLGGLLFLKIMCHHQHHNIWLGGEFQSHYLAEIEYWSSTLCWMDRERFCQKIWNIFVISFNKDKERLSPKIGFGHMLWGCAMINACNSATALVLSSHCHL